MKYDVTLNMMGKVLKRMIATQITDKNKLKAIQDEYKTIILRADDIGNKNKLIMSYALAAYFIAMNRHGGLTPEENFKLLDDQIRTRKLVKALMGSSKNYFSEKNMESRRAWSKQTYERKYKNDWVVDVLEKTPEYEFGLDYRECGVCKLCRDEKCPELAKYLCGLDYTLVDIMDIRLIRTMTLAEGGTKCDFRFQKK